MISHSRQIYLQGLVLGIIIMVYERIFMKNKRNIMLFLRVIAYGIFLGAIIYGAYSSPYNPHPKSTEDIRHWVAGFGSLAPFW